MVDVPPGPRRPLRLLPRLQRLLLERQGRPRHRARDRARALRRPRPRRMARQAAAGPGPEPRPRRDDERGTLAVQLQPQPRSVRRLGPGRASGPTPPGSGARRCSTNGASLIAQMLRIALDRGIPVWTEAPLEELIVEDGRVVGVRTVRDGVPVLVRARKGVLLAVRRLRPQPRDARASTEATSPTGPGGRSRTRATPARCIQIAMGLGAKTDLMDEAWWLPVAPDRALRAVDARPGPPAPAHHLRRRRRQRFVNESNSYMEVGKAMYARDKTSRAVPCWLIFDDRYRKRYAHQRSSPGRFPRSCSRAGCSSRPGR